MTLATRRSLLLMVAFMVLTALIFRRAPPPRIAPTDPCAPAEHRAACYREEVTRIAGQDGTRAAFDFINHVVRPTSYITAHLLSHGLGHKAFHRTGSVPLAFAELPPEARTLERYFLYDGFQHGVLEAFFAANPRRAPLELAREGCAQYFGAPPEEAAPDRRVAAEQCFHAVGHALMYANGNDINHSLAACDRLPDTWMRNWCGYGVFMENSYLYSPNYAPGAPRPFATGASMAPLCAAVASRYRPQCAGLVGRAHLALKWDDFAGAFAECDPFEPALRRICVSQVAWLFIPSAFRDDVRAMARTCHAAGPDDEATCIRAVASGIRQGTAGLNHGPQPFCEAVALEFQASCRQAGTAMYYEGYLWNDS